MLDRRPVQRVAHLGQRRLDRLVAEGVDEAARRLGDGLVDAVGHGKEARLDQDGEQGCRVDLGQQAGSVLPSEGKRDVGPVFSLGQALVVFANVLVQDPPRADQQLPLDLKTLDQWKVVQF